MLGSRVSALEVRDTLSSDNSLGVGVTGDNLRQPDSEEKHAMPVEAPPYQLVDQHVPFEASAQHQHAASAHSAATEGQPTPIRWNP